MANKEITALPTSTNLNPTDWFHIKQGSTDVKMNVGTVLEDHIASANPHNVTKSQVGLGSVDDAAQLVKADNLSDIPDASAARGNLDVRSTSEITNEIAVHANNSANPHEVTKSQVGLANVNNYTISHDPRDNNVNRYASAAAVAALSAEFDAVVPDGMPKGAIIMWSQNAGAIPSGYALCNGQTIGGIVTPDLTGKFIRASTVGDTGVTGGNNSVEHTHSGTTGGHALTINEMPEHSHDINTRTYGNYRGAYDDNRVGQGSEGTAYVRSLVIEPNGGGAPHNHTVSLDNASVSTVPEFYNLAYIMKYI